MKTRAPSPDRPASPSTSAPATRWRRGLAHVAASLALTLATGSAGAAQHALILWIGDYPEPSAKLKGIPLDAEMARRMARLLGVPQANVIERHDAQLSFDGMKLAWAELAARMRPGDKVFIYFSGHGRQLPKAGAPGCQEGLVTHDRLLYMDALLRDDLERIGSQASQVLMFNDSCHSGGAVIKGLRGLVADDAQTKAYPGDLDNIVEAKGTAAAASADPVCGQQTNIAKGFRGLVEANATDRILHLAASADNQAAFATSRGSIATQAWTACLEASARRGSTTTGAALTICAQQWIRDNAAQQYQTITPSLNQQMSISLQLR